MENPETSTLENQQVENKFIDPDEPTVYPASRWSDMDIHLFREGRHFRLYNHLGSHLMEHEGKRGTYFALWAPNAREVSVIGNFNGWQPDQHKLFVRQDSSGIWEGFIPGIRQGEIYKYHIRAHSGYIGEKGDPFAMLWEVPPRTASVVWDIKNAWGDESWMEALQEKNFLQEPYSVYELHLGSWMRRWDEGNPSLSYRELAEHLPPYIKELGFTHVEFMPVMEHPFYGSWGYQITGYFAPSSRYGTPQDFMYLVDTLHQEGIGVLLDWVPSHFPSDEHGLAYFDGTHLYEHADPRKGYHPDWKSYIFNYGRHEVKSFLISNALFWLDKYHADGLRVDAVASMLYLDYSREEGEWIPNEFGGRENLEAIQFLREFNEAVHQEYPGVVTVAEESTAWPMITRPTYMGGLGFSMKWMMGWMHDSLQYFSREAVYRKYHQGEITFSILYAFTENFMLPFSHDEVVHGKGSMLDKMPGDYWQKHANLRLLYSLMYAHPGGKLLFMGCEFGQEQEWKHDQSIDWHLTDNYHNRGLMLMLKKLNELYREEKALYEKQFEYDTFEWVDINDHENSVISFLRKDAENKEPVLIVMNFTPVVRSNYMVGVPEKGHWQEIFNSDSGEYSGSNARNAEPVEYAPISAHGRPYAITLTLPPLGAVFLKKVK